MQMSKNVNNDVSKNPPIHVLKYPTQLSQYRYILGQTQNFFEVKNPTQLERLALRKACFSSKLQMIFARFNINKALS